MLMLISWETDVEMSVLLSNCCERWQSRCWWSVIGGLVTLVLGQRNQDRSGTLLYVSWVVLAYSFSCHFPPFTCTDTACGCDDWSLMSLHHQKRLDCHHSQQFDKGTPVTIQRQQTRSETASKQRSVCCNCHTLSLSLPPQKRLDCHLSQQFDKIALIFLSVSRLIYTNIVKFE